MAVVRRALHGISVFVQTHKSSAPRDVRSDGGPDERQVSDSRLEYFDFIEKRIVAQAAQAHSLRPSPVVITPDRGAEPAKPAVDPERVDPGPA
jgi:hypothetical protein